MSHHKIVGVGIDFGRYHLRPYELFDAHQARLHIVHYLPSCVSVMALLAAILSRSGIALDL